MANAVTLTSSWIGEFFADVFLYPAIGEGSDFNLDVYDVDPTVNNKRIDYAASELKYVTHKKTGCGFDPQGSMALTERVLQVVPFAVELEQCFDTFYNTAFRAKLKRGTNITDLDGTFLQTLFEGATANAIGKDLVKIGWFGDDSLATTSFLSPLDGWFTLMEQDANVTKYSFATSGGGDLAEGAVLATLREMWGNNLILRGKASNSTILATTQVYDNLINTYEQLGTCCGLARLMEGGALTFRGVEIVSMEVWDETITDFGLNNPHRLVWSLNDNLRVGTDVTNPRNEGKMFSDELTEMTYFKARFDFGVNYRFSNTLAYARS